MARSSPHAAISRICSRKREMTQAYRGTMPLLVTGMLSLGPWRAASKSVWTDWKNIVVVGQPGEGGGGCKGWMPSTRWTCPASETVHCEADAVGRRLYAHPVSLLYLCVFLLGLLHGFGLQFLRSPVQPDKYTPGG